MSYKSKSCSWTQYLTLKINKYEIILTNPYIIYCKNSSIYFQIKIQNIINLRKVQITELKITHFLNENA